MKKRTLTALSLLLIAVLCCATVVYAFFQVIMSIGEGNEPQLEVTGSPVQEVYTEQQLFAVTQDGYYNPHEGISEGEKRVTVKFTGNITLTSDLFITADVHIDLNGYTLILGGSSVTVMHDYIGTFVIEGGYIQLSKSAEAPLEYLGKLYVSTPFADVFIDVAFTDGERVLDEEEYVDCIEYINADKKIIAYNIFYMIANLLKSGYSHSLKLINYGKLIQDYASGGTLNYAAIEFNNASYYCPFGEEEGECFDYYLSNDVDLPLSYHNYPIKITYSCDPEGLISDKGEVNPDQNEVKTATLTASVTFEGESAPYASYDYSIVLIHPQDTENQSKLARARILDYLRAYEGEYDVDGDGENIVSGYIFNGEVSLPGFDELSGTTFIYEVYDEDKELKDGSDYFRAIGDSYIFAVSADISYLRVFCGEDLHTDYLHVYGQSVTIEDNYTIAQNIVSQWYSNAIIITDNTASGINGYTFQTLYKDISAFANKGVLSVEYSIINNVDGTYAINEGEETSIFQVVAGKHPNELQRVFLTVSFTFAEWAEAVNISIPVLYNADSSAGGSQIHPFLPYYIYFNRIFASEAGASTYLSFSMPLYYPSGSPAVVYDITGDEQGAISLQLFYGGNAHTLELGSFTSYADAFDDYLEDISLTLKQFLDNYPDAEWFFNIDIDKIGKTDNEISLIYNYKFGSRLGGSYDYTSADWEVYTAADSSFILSGILRTVYTNGATDNTGVPAAVLYKWIYDNYNTMGDSYNFSTDKFTKYVLTNWLTQEKVIDNSSNNLFNINNYKGIEFLTGVKVLKLNEMGISTAQNMNAWIRRTSGGELMEEGIIYFISQMSGLEELYLSNNALYDRAQSSAAFPTGDDNDFIGVLSALSNLKTLDLSDNKIFDFSDLAAFVSLENVYTYNNTHTSTIGWAAIRDVLTNMSNGTYGSWGSTNMAVYQQIYQERGVKVYYLNRTSFYSGGGGVSDYSKMKNIVYQDKLPEGVSIEKAYEFLSRNPDHYDIDLPSIAYRGLTDRIITFSYEGEGNPEDATEFTMTYSYRAEIQNGTSWGQPTYEWITITVTARFSVTRIADGEQE